MKPKKKFKVRLQYFKASGKFYTDGELEEEFPTLEHDPDAVYMYAVFDRVRELRDSGGPLPGLRGSWCDGPIYVDCEEGYPGLVMPSPYATPEPPPAATSPAAHLEALETKVSQLEQRVAWLENKTGHSYFGD